MNVGPTIEANAKTAEVMEPGVSPFNHPAEFSETTAVFGAAPRNDWLDTALAQELPMRVGIVATICKDALGLLKRPAARAADRNYRIDERQQLGDIVAVGAGQEGTDGDAIGIDEDLVRGTRSRAIRGVRTCFSPAPAARIDEESTTAYERSIWPASRCLSSSNSSSRPHTPAFCQSRGRR